MSREASSAVLAESSKKSIKFSMKLDGVENIITGIRVRVDFSCNRSASQNLSLKLFSRVFKFKNYSTSGSQQSLWFDIPFCDVEILYGSASANNMTFEFQTEDPKNCPIRICGLEVFCVSRKEFGYREKMKKLEKQNAERLTRLASLSPQNNLSDQAKE